MVEVKPGSSEKEVLDIVIHWVDVLAKGDFDTFANALGYTMDGDPAADCIRRDIANYRSPGFYPGVNSFVVTSWREAKGGNPEPRQEVIWYEPNASMLAGAITIDLPLNGKWSDLQADFVLLDDRCAESYILKLEEIFSWKQRALENDER